MNKTGRSQVAAVVVSRAAAGQVQVGLERIELPKVKAGQIVVRPAYVGICGSDLEQLAGHLPSTFEVTYPHVLGHEWSGEVVEVGASVADFRVGDRVIGHGDLGGNRWFGVTDDGAMAELFVIDAAVCFAVPPNVDLQSAAVVEPFACVFAALRRVGHLNASQQVHVHGLGAIGLCAVIQTAAVGAAVTVIDPSVRRRELALELGASRAVDPMDPDAMADLSTAADLVIEASGSPLAQAAALESGANDGRILMMGVSKPRGVTATLGLIQQRNLHVLSSTGAPSNVWEPALRMLDRLRIDLRPLVSATFPFDAIEDALARAADPGRETKVLVHP